jgi:hypothetical protein
MQPNYKPAESKKDDAPGLSHSWMTRILGSQMMYSIQTQKVWVVVI